MPMLQLFYISTARRIDGEMMFDILKVSRTNNVLCDVTGILVQGGNRFLQILEGPAKAVEETFARIRRDERHAAIVMLGRDWIEERSFPDWAMAYEEVGAVGDQRLGPVVDALVERLKNESLKAELRSFAQLHSAA